MIIFGDKSWNSQQLLSPQSRLSTLDSLSVPPHSHSGPVSLQQGVSPNSCPVIPGHLLPRGPNDTCSSVTSMTNTSFTGCSRVLWPSKGLHLLLRGSLRLALLRGSLRLAQHKPSPLWGISITADLWTDSLALLRLSSVCFGVYVHLSMHVNLQLLLGRDQKTTLCIIARKYHLFWRQDLFLSWRSPSRPDWFTSEPQGAVCLCLLPQHWNYKHTTYTKFFK